MTGGKWKDAFFPVVSRFEKASLLRESALQENLTDWTKYLTEAVVQTCESMAGRRLQREANWTRCQFNTLSTYLWTLCLQLDPGGKWRYPIAVMELENSREDERIAYSLWKVFASDQT